MQAKTGFVFVIATAGIMVFAQQPAQTPAGTPTQPPAGRGRQGGLPNIGRTTFPQHARTLAPPEVLTRGKAVYGVNCSACHGPDLRGGDQGGPSLLRSLVALSDQHGEEISPIIHGSRVEQGMPKFNLNDADTTAVAEYIHSMLAKVEGAGAPPRGDLPKLNVLVGNAQAGEAYFQANCTSCHSLANDLKGIGAKYADPRMLQNTWVSGRAGGGRGGQGGRGGKPSTVTVTFPDGQKLEGELLREDDFVVTLLLPGGTRKSIARNDDVPKVEVHDPDAAHRKIILTLADKDMHNVTAYLATVK
jgi:cytochrome c oxidase cbb3-type subunit 3